MIKIFRKIIYCNKGIFNLAVGTLNLINKIKRGNQHNCVKNKGFGKIKKDIIGTHNEILVEQDTFMLFPYVKIRGNNNKLHIKRNCSIGPNCSFWMEGDDISIEIGEGTTFTETCHINAQENGKKIIIGKDCMFSNSIIVRTSDSHPILDKSSGERINFAGDIVIGEHVWIAPKTSVYKGVHIGTGSIIGSNSLVTHDVPDYSIAVGMPAKTIKTNVCWTRDKLF